MMANFRYNPSSGGIEPSDGHNPGDDGDESQVTTRFLVMREGQLIFEGVEKDLRMSRDAYVQKFAKAGSS